MKVLRASSVTFFLVALLYFLFTILIYDRGSSDIALKMNAIVHILFSLGMLILFGVFFIISAIIDLRR